MAEDKRFDPDFEWMDHVRPVGLVVAPQVLKHREAIPERQTQIDTAAASALLDLEGTRALPDPWAFVRDVLGWDASFIAGAPDGPELPQELMRHYVEHDTTLGPTWAVAEPDKPGEWQLLVKLEDAGVKPDKRSSLDGWEATSNQRFERLLRDTGVFAGLLITDEELRIVYAPRGESSGWMSFPLKALSGVSGRAMLGGLKVLLGHSRLFTEQSSRRLPALLKQSREAQAEVSTKLSGQVLGALYELQRGLNAADGELIADLARKRPAHLYEGLLTVLMRLVFTLYAEDRDVIPSFQEPAARALYAANYGVRGLYGRLSEDAALNPDTMDERFGAWGRLLALFRLIHGGGPEGFVQARGGKLFDPDAFPFLEGRRSVDEAPCVLKISDGCLFRILDDLTTIAGDQARERLSYRSLDVEQIGSVYETIMGFEAALTTGPSIAIKAGKSNRTPVFVDLDALAKLNGDARLKHLKEEVNRASLSAGIQQAVKAAATVESLAQALDQIVDERASPKKRPVERGTPILQPTNERRRSGSHYTPRSLTEPIVRFALEPTFKRLGERATPQDILELKVCDPAMGSGAFLVEACRQLATRLVQAWAVYPGQRPSVPGDEDEDLHARRLVAQRCLYGVDKNAMATDLARLSLWLATLARDHEFTFLDHALKAGDSLVGLTLMQIAAAHWDGDKPGLPLLRSLVSDRIKKALEGRQAIREAPDDVKRLVQEQRHKGVEQGLVQLRLAGDAVIAAFFAESKTKAREQRRINVESWFGGADKALWEKLSGEAMTLSYGRNSLRPFHWQIEFPEVFGRENSGFDAIIGNPPFLGGTAISEVNGMSYFQWLSSQYAPAGHHADLCAYFLRRCYQLLGKYGIVGVLTSSTISQGDSREGGLVPLLSSGATLLRAIRKYEWPGEANVYVGILHIGKNLANISPVLDGRTVRRISAYLLEGFIDQSPQKLSSSIYFSLGSKIYSQGFLFDDEDQAANNDSLRIEIQKDSKERERIFSYIGGEEINKDPRQIGHRYAIDANDIETESDLSALKGIYSVITSKVKPGRLLLGDNPNNTPLKKYWWRYQAHRPQLYDRIRRRAYTLAIARVTPYVLFSLLSTDQIFSEQVCVIDSDSMKLFSVIQSRAHELWALHLSSSMGDTLRYTPSDVFATFPVPLRLEDSSALEAVGAAYHLHRAQLMIENDEGLTRTYNRFHDPDDMTPGIVELRRLHDAMDQAVMTAYGWDSALKRLAVPGFEPLFDEDEDEATARRARKKFRYRWPEEVRDEVLARLLALNAERATEERKALESGADESAKRTPAARGKGRRKASGMNDLLGDA